MKLFEIKPPITDEERQERAAEGIAENENGAMLIMGIFMVMFVAAMLYYVVGVGDTIMYRERMQDAADAGAMNGAIFLARGMNLITLLNLTLASVFGVLVAAQTAFFILLAAAGKAASECNPPYRIAPCFQAICLLIAVGRSCDKIEDAKDHVSDAADVTTSMQDSIRQTAPLAATAAVFQMGRNHYAPPVTVPLGIYGDVVDDLPVEEDPDPPICDRTINFWAKGGFPLFSWLATSFNAGEIADDLGGSCGGGYVDDMKPTGYAFSLLACQMQAGEVDNKLYRVESGAELGDENFQFHTLMTGEPAYGIGADNNHAQRVSVATWGEESEGMGIWGALQQLSRFSFAQAEFLFDDDKDREDWLWELKWRARLRRFQCSDSSLLSPVCIDAVDAAVSH